MANGWGPEGGIQDQIDATVTDALSAARSRLPSGEGTVECEVCGDEIPLRRRQAIPSVRTCIACQSERDKQPTISTINRRGNKDSQLR
ncbi:MAG TPA: DksA/TraR family C4-type zinc finger protein [Agrobacterium sp.]|uniref:DksA/TraR family C4-type zinc finger protein n=1 Tax=Agrobacterium pusense TaxID=648995 RepID=UPI000E993F67|nr:DksA/TraR family C4-type zinc finger protein [Agrobacterium sp.]